RPVTPEPDEERFRSGWSLYRRGDYARAAEVFAEVGAKGAWFEDASYWRGQALLRAGRDQEAISVLRDFLGRHPDSPHAGELRVTLGWLALRSGHSLEAQRLFKRAAEDP